MPKPKTIASSLIKSLTSKRLKSIMDEGENLLLYVDSRDEHGDIVFEPHLYYAWKTRTLLCLRDLLGTKHDYYIAFERAVFESSYHDAYNFKMAFQLVRTIKDEFDKGFLEGIRGIIQSELLGDFLTMAEHLIEEQYKDAAAVIIGAVLEDHLRLLCTKNRISLTAPTNSGSVRNLKSSELNDLLAKAKVYELPMQQAVKGWQAIRNSAAHGKFSDYKLEEVNLMFVGVRQFLRAHTL